MCGRFAIYSSVQAIMEYAAVINSLKEFKPNYNASPGQKIPVILPSDGKHRLDAYKWGLIPFWAKDIKTGYKMINARAETIAEKASFKYAFQKKRCLIPANGFYEWRRSDKQPFFIRVKNRDLFTFAGLWESWQSPKGENIHSCCIITTQPNEFMENIHSRMPVILKRNDEESWLTTKNPVDLLPLLSPTKEILIGHEISRDVNSTANNYPELLKEIEESDIFTSN